jgi:hypothetical protein
LSESCTFVPKAVSCGQVIKGFRRSQKLYKEKGIPKILPLLITPGDKNQEKSTITHQKMQAGSTDPFRLSETGAGMEGDWERWDAHNFAQSAEWPDL